MVDVEFDFNQGITVIQSQLKDSFQETINKYLQKSLFDSASVYFITNGKKVNPSESIEKHMSKLDKEKCRLKVLVFMKEEEGKDKEQVIVKTANVICPECKEPCRITFQGYSIKLFDCINGHITEDISINEFEDTQKVNISEKKCENCKFKNKGNCPKDEFYLCLTCQKNLCIFCKSNHNTKHNIIKYDQKYFICQKHNEPIISYCKECKMNICFSCEGHENHAPVFLKDIMPNLDDLNNKKNLLDELKKIIESIDISIQEAANLLKRFSNVLKKYYDIINDIMSNYDPKRRNFQNLQNLKEISPNKLIFNTIKNISKEIDIKNKIIGMIDFYRKINIEKKKKEPSKTTSEKDNKKIIITNLKELNDILGKNKKFSFIYNSEKVEKEIIGIVLEQG